MLVTPDLWSLGMGQWVSGEVGVSTATLQDRCGEHSRSTGGCHGRPAVGASVRIVLYDFSVS